MAKEKQIFFCRECGFESAKWMGQCPGCRSWNTFCEEKVTVGARKQSGGRTAVVPTSILEVKTADETRFSTGLEELNRVLGGGIVNGSLVLVGGDPGIGKSTILLQMCRNLSADGHKILYVSGEESLSQIKMRAERIGTFQKDMLLLCVNNLEDVEEYVKKDKPKVIVIDSIQTIVVEDIASAPGSVSQVKEVTARLMQMAKQMDIAIFIVGHVTKEGTVAGPRNLEHMVDTVLYFEGDRNAGFRILRAVKNRFGSTNEIGVFEMLETGLSESYLFFDRGCNRSFNRRNNRTGNRDHNRRDNRSYDGRFFRGHNNRPSCFVDSYKVAPIYIRTTKYVIEL